MTRSGHLSHVLHTADVACGAYRRLERLPGKPEPSLAAYLTIVGRTGVRPDSVQVPVGKLASRLPTRVVGVALQRFAFPSGAVPARG